MVGFIHYTTTTPTQYCFYSFTYNVAKMQLYYLLGLVNCSYIAATALQKALTNRNTYSSIALKTTMNTWRNVASMSLNITLNNYSDIVSKA